MATTNKRLIEVLLISAEINGIPEKGLLKSRHLGTVDLIWPRAGIAKRSAAREMVFHRGQADFTAEPWAKRILFREEVDDHAALAVTVSEAITLQKIRRYVRMAMKYALKQGADFVESAMVGYGDIASAPVDALAALVAEKDAPKAVAQGVVDVAALPSAGEETTISIPLYRPKLLKQAVGSLTVVIRA